MKPRCLTLQAFGPFAGREVIDFAKLPSDALFLIHGPTGAGKSTLLDGICFALYGTTSGGERQPKEMRSHHAADNVQTEVELEFDLGAKRFRVKRIPEQERAAKKGEAKMVNVLTKAELHEWNGTEWNLLAAKATEVSSRIATLLGFEVGQFRQVIMLPQGQFRELLSADSKDREKILEALFTTETYKRLQERLQASAHKLQERATDAENKRTTLLQQAEVESEDALVQLIAEARQELVTLAADAIQRRKEEDTAQQFLSAGDALAVKFKERDTAQTSLEQLNEAEHDIATKRLTHNLALRAQNVVPAWTSANDARSQHKNDLAKVTQAIIAADEAAKTVVTATTSLKTEEKKAPEREAAAREIAQLDEFRVAVVRLNEAETERNSAVQHRKSTDAEVGKLEQQVKAQIEQRLALNQQVELFTPLAARAEALKLEVTRLEQQLKTLHQIAASETSISKLRGEASQFQSALVMAQSQLETARHSLADIDAKWRAGQAAVLAGYLSDGIPCPVCGNHEHPHPAVGGTDTPSEEQLKAAVEQVAKTEAAVEKARQAEQASAQKSAAAEATLAALRDTFGNSPNEAPPTIATAESALSKLSNERDQALKAVDSLADIRTTLSTCEQQLGAAQKALEAARILSSEAATKVATAESVWAERAAQVPENLRNPTALENALAQAKVAHESLTKLFKQAQDASQAAQNAQAGAVAALKTLQEAAEGSQQRLQTAQIALIEALTHSGFADEAAFTVARQAPEAITALAQYIQQHDQALATARERLARAVAAVEGVQPPNLEELASNLNAAKIKLEAVLAEQHTLQAKITERTRTLEMLKQISVELGDIATRYKVMGQLADIANGKNGANLTFQRYVLAALLDDVLGQASQRLRKMTSNRYTLQRFKEVSDKRRASGLDIEVFDEQTGTARSANTLSGGEGFMASLSLALGLSDVVQGYAGGIQLDTLFIDEGFGTLDAESLDMAMKALIELQQKGRLVGIISHVDELKQQLQHGIEIRHAAGGSSVRVGAIAGH